MSITIDACVNRTGRYAPLNLAIEQRRELEKLIRAGNAPARTQTRARILLLLDGQPPIVEVEGRIAATLLVHRDTVKNVRGRFAAGGLERALYDLPRPGAAPKITGDVEAQLTLLACSDAPDGRSRWTLRLLADKLIELGVVESISHVAISRALKKTKLSLGGSHASASVRRRGALSR